MLADVGFELFQRFPAYLSPPREAEEVLRGKGWRVLSQIPERND